MREQPSRRSDQQHGETLVFGLYVGFLLGAALAGVLVSFFPVARW